MWIISLLFCKFGKNDPFWYNSELSRIPMTRRTVQKSRVFTLDASRVATRDVSRIYPGLSNAELFKNPGWPWIHPGWSPWMHPGFTLDWSRVVTLDASRVITRDFWTFTLDANITLDDHWISTPVVTYYRSRDISHLQKKISQYFLYY